MPFMLRLWVAGSCAVKPFGDGSKPESVVEGIACAFDLCVEVPVAVFMVCVIALAALLAFWAAWSASLFFPQEAVRLARAKRVTVRIKEAVVMVVIGFLGLISERRSAIYEKKERIR
jgi:hypothetical protein